MSKDDCLTLRGQVVKAAPGGKFTVKLETGQEVKAQISGKIRQNKIQILIFDEVDVEISPYDLTQGRISYRY